MAIKVVNSCLAKSVFIRAYPWCLMNDETKSQQHPKHIWPWFVLAAVVLGIILFVVWVWVAVQKVKWQKANTLQGSSSVFTPRDIAVRRR